MRLLFFGTYDAGRHPRVRVLQEGFAAHGDEIIECNIPLDVDTSERVRILREPWRLPLFGVRILAAWSGLWRKSRQLPAVDAVVVGYMGHFDIHLARRLRPKTILVLDHLIFAEDTVVDRGVSARRLLSALRRLDVAALRAADVICVDTGAHRELLPEASRARAVVVPVGAPEQWFSPPRVLGGSHLRVIFFGLYTPLQGAPTIGHAIRLLLREHNHVSFTMIGTGQDRAATADAASDSPGVTWRDWVEPDQLPSLVAEHHVCLGIFGTSAKATRVVPNKVFQGAAAGAAIVTSNTAPQMSALAGAGVFVPPGDARALAEAIGQLASDPGRVAELREAAHRRAAEAFRPAVVVEALRDALSVRVEVRG